MDNSHYKKGKPLLYRLSSSACRGLIAILYCFTLFINNVAAEDIFPKEITSSFWAEYGNCGTENYRYFIFSGGFIGDGNLCASTDSSRVNDVMYHLFMECSMKGHLVTYMGKSYFYEDYFDINLTEYRGGTGADDFNLQLTRCEEKD